VYCVLWTVSCALRCVLCTVHCVPCTVSVYSLLCTAVYCVNYLLKKRASATAPSQPGERNDVRGELDKDISTQYRTQYRKEENQSSSKQEREKTLHHLVMSSVGTFVRVEHGHRALSSHAYHGRGSLHDTVNMPLSASGKRSHNLSLSSILFNSILFSSLSLSRARFLPLSLSLSLSLLLSSS
jgi:hypothetical protein